MISKTVTLRDIADKVFEYDNFVVCGHVSPDGDCIGSCLAFSHILKALKKKCCLLLADANPKDYRYEFLKDYDKFQNSNSFNCPFDKFCFVQLDAGFVERCGSSAKNVKEAADFSITIDHHIIDKVDSDYFISDAQSASASLLVWKLAKEIGICENLDVANACYLGLLTDTGYFRQANTNAECFVLASEMVKSGVDPQSLTDRLFHLNSVEFFAILEIALHNLYVDKSHQFAITYVDYNDFLTTNATYQDVGKIIDYIKSLEGINVFCILKQYEKNGNIRGSLRSLNDVDVFCIARSYDGGGHKAAAGFTIYHSDMSVAFKEVKQKLLDSCC